MFYFGCLTLHLGKLIDVDGSKYEGQFEDNKFNGQGNNIRC